ncbi:MAG: hypothetical protein K5869_09260 [Saccharofermentans sp.]|nr:hypothetical protein [Saccharofermentans sp.]
MNKKFWVLLATSAMLATSVMATGCAAQKNMPVPTAVSVAIESPAETTAAPEEQNEPVAFDAAKNNTEEKAVTENAFIPGSAQNEEDDNDDSAFNLVEKKAPKKTTVKKTGKTTTVKPVKKSPADNTRLMIVKSARADAVKNASMFMNMNEKIAAARSASAKKVAAQKNADARKNMNQAAQQAQNAAKEEAGKKAAQKAAQKAAGKTAAEKTAESKKAAAKKTAESRKAYEKKIAAKRALENKAQAKRDAAKKRPDHKKQIVKNRHNAKWSIEHFKKLMGISRTKDTRHDKEVRIIM